MKDEVIEAIGRVVYLQGRGMVSTADRGSNGEDRVAGNNNSLD